MTASPTLARAPDERWRDSTSLLLTLAACAAAGAAEVFGQSAWFSHIGFAAAAIMAGIAASRSQAFENDVREDDTRQPAPWSFYLLVSAATLFCLTASAAVYFRFSPGLTHPLWLAGLGTYGAAAFVGRRRAEGGRSRDSWRTLGILSLLLVVSGLLFAWDLSSIPPEVHGDDAEVGLDALFLLESKPFNLFDTGWFGLPRFHALPTAVGLEVFGANLLGLRATSAVLGVGTVLLLFAVARRLWGFEVALLAALFLSSQRFFIHLSRAGYHYIDTPFLSVLVVWLFLRAWQDKRLSAALWCGIALGLGIQTYFASRLVPLLLVGTWVLWMVDSDDDERRPAKQSLALIVLTALATAAPILAHFAGDPESLWGRFRETSVFNPDVLHHLGNGYRTDSIWEILTLQFRAALTLFHRTPDTSVQYGYNQPLLEPLGVVLFVLGLGGVLARATRRPNRLLLLWVAAPLIAGAALTVDAPFYPRISGLLPFAAVLMALGARQILSAVRGGLAGRSGRWLATALAASLVVVVFANNIRTYFLDYAPNHRHSPLVEISRWVRENGLDKTTYMFTGPRELSVHHGTMAFLTHGYETRDVRDPARDLMNFDLARSLFVVLPVALSSSAQLTDVVGPLDLVPHRSTSGAIQFYTGVPADAAEPQRPSEQPHRPTAQVQPPGGVPPSAPIGQRLAKGLHFVGDTALAALLLALTLAALAASLRRRQPDHRPVLARPTARAYGSALLRRLFGPNERERQGEPPRSVTWVLLAAITVIAAMLRVYDLGNLPPGFFCDEAGLGYNAYSILHSGRDESGEFLPLYVWSFKVSYKNPVFIYSSMIPLALLGPTELAVRLTAATYGVATVVAMFFLGRALWGAWLGLLAALFLAVCPWHLHFSRIAFELIAYPFFFVLGLTSLIRYAQGRRTLPQAMVLFGISLYSYVPAKLFVPLFVAGFSLVYWRTLLARWRESLLALALLVMTVTPVVVFDLGHSARSSSYLRATSPLAQHDSFTQAAGHFATNVQAFFSPEFLFQRGDRITRHAVKGHGELYPFFQPLLLLGMVAAIARRDRLLLLILWWLALYPLAPSLMNEIPSASRGFIGAPAFCLLAAVGGTFLLRLPTQLVARRPGLLLAAQLAAVGAGLFVLAPQVQRYWELYTGDYRNYAAKYYSGFQFGHRQVVEYFDEHYDQYSRLILTPALNNQPEVFLAFYSGLRNPSSTGVPPFQAGHKMRVVSPEEFNLYNDGETFLLAARPEELLLFDDYEVRKQVLAPDGTAAFVLAEVSQPKDFVFDWRVLGAYDKAYMPPPPDFDPKAPPRKGHLDRPWRNQREASARVRLHRLYGFEDRQRCAWAVNFLYTDKREVNVFAGFDDDGEVWVNGQKVPLLRTGNDPATLVDQKVGKVQLRSGRNTVAIRTCNSRDEWLMYFRVAGTDGRSLADLEWEYDTRQTRRRPETQPVAKEAAEERIRRQDRQLPRAQGALQDGVSD